MVLEVGMPIKSMKRACRGYCMGVVKIHEIHRVDDDAYCSYQTTR